MNGGFRDRVRGEKGAITAGGLIGIGLVLLFLYLLLAAFEGDPAQFGEVAVPGSGAVELPEGDVDVHYAEGADPDAGVELITPADLRLTITGPGGQDVPVTARGEEPESTDDGISRLIGSLRATEEGTYKVETESSEAAQRITPAVTFGQGPFAAIGQRFEGVVDVLRGPVGIVLLVLLAILYVLPRWQGARRRAAYRDK